MPEDLVPLEDLLAKRKAEEAALKAQNSANQFDAAAIDDEPDFDLEEPAEYLYTQQQARDLIMQGHRILGSPAASLTWGIDGNTMKASLRPGMQGEKNTAHVLNEFAKNHQGVYVFHSLQWPDSKGDTDHILVYKDLVLILDSKRWKSNKKYSFTPQGNIKRGTVAFPEGKVKMRGAMYAWKKKIPTDVTVFGTIVISQEKVFVVRDANWFKNGFKMVELERLEEHLLETFQTYKPGSDKTSLALLSFFGSVLVKPKNLLDGILNKEALL